MAFTKPTGEQISFRSSKTGTHNLDTYLEACEKGTVSLPAMLDELFGSTGELNPNAIGFRVSTSSGTPIFQARFGTFTDATSGWFDTDQSFFHWRGDYAASTAYKLLDMVRLPTNESIYICTVAHTSTGTLDTSKFQEFFDGANVTAVIGSLSNINSVAANQTNINSLATALGTITTYAVTVASVGGSNKYHLDGTTAPTLSLFRGNSYIFDLSDSSNAGHPLAFKDGSGNNYTTGVVTSGTPGSSGATVTITVASNAPSSLSYYCTVHGAGMGNTITVASSNLSTVASNISGVNTVSTNISAVNTVAGVASTMSAAASNAAAAANSAAAAANSASAAATAFDTFDDRYLGSKSSEPSTDNDGNALVSGSLFFDSSANAMKVYDGSSWITATSAGASSLVDYEYTATAGQTTFTGADNNSATLTYTTGNILVSLNGVILDNGSDYTATSGSSIVLASAAASGDHLAVVAFKSFSVSDTVSASAGGTFGGGVTVSGTLTATAAQVNGNIAVTGTVDGRDIASDGTKLDTNIPSSLGTAGQVLTVNPAGNAGAWVEASGGGEQTFTASGSITAGNIVGINSSGTVEVMGQAESGVVQVGTRDPYSPEYFPQGIATDGNGKILAVIGTSANGGPAAYVGTITGTTISWGSEAEITSNTDQYSPQVTYDANAGKFLIYWYNASGSYTGHAVVATISGTSVSFGTILQVSSAGRQGQVLYNPDTQSSLIAFMTTSGIWAHVATISGTSVSLGNPLQISSGSSHAYPRLTYDTAANKYLCAYKKGNGNGAAKVLTVSGTSVTAGSEATFETTGTVYYLGTTYDPTANRHIMQYHPNSGAQVVAGTISGTSVTFGTRISMPVTILSSPHYNPVIQRTMITGSGYNYYYKIIFGSGNTISFNGADTTQWLDDGTVPSNAGPNFVNVNSTRNCWLWENSNKAKSLVINDAMVKFVGLAKENISDGASGKVTVMGGINTSVSSLTAGKSYGLPVDSAVITEITDLTSTKIFGTALSSTSIYIDKGNLR